MKSFLLTTVGFSLALAPTSTIAQTNGWHARWIERLGWTLIHSVWQLAVIASLAAFLQITLRHRPATLRYLVAVTAMMTMLALPCITWTTLVIAPHASALLVSDAIAMDRESRNHTTTGKQHDQSIVDRAGDLRSKQNESLDASANGVASEGLTSGQPRFVENFRAAIDPWITSIVSMWLVGVAICSLRPIWGLWVQWRLHQVGLSPAPEFVQARLLELARHMGLANVVRVAESAAVRIPMVVGYLRPVILLPASVLTGLTPNQLESLLAHELAHVRRHDWLVNAIQVLVETVLFYHPAAWWLSNQIRHERELCCDDLAITVIGDRVTYGRMLLAVEELRQAGLPTAVVIAATGGNLVQRIRRLIPSPDPAERASRGWLSGMVLVMAMGVLLVLMAMTMDSQAPLITAPSQLIAAEDDVPSPTKAQHRENFNPANARLRAELNSPTEVAFVDIPLRDGLDYLASTHNIRIELDPVALEEMSELGDPGSTPVTTLRIKGQSLAETLMLLLHPLDLSYLVDNGKLVVTTTAEAQRRGEELPFDFGAILDKLSAYPVVQWSPILKGEFDSADAETISNIEAALSDADPVIQRQAANALYQVAGSATSAVPHLKKALNSDDLGLRRAVYRALAAIGRDDLTTIPFLMEAWSNDEVVRREMPFLIREFDERVYVELAKQFHTATPELRMAMISSLRLPSKPYEELVLRGLADTDEQIRRTSLGNATQVLFRPDAISDELVTALRPFLKSMDIGERLQVAKVFLHITADARTALEILLQPIAEGDPWAGTEAINQFKTLSYSPSSAFLLAMIEQLNEIATTEQNETRMAAMRALAAMQNTKAPYKNLNVTWGPIHDGLQCSLNIAAPNPMLTQPFSLQLEVRKSDKQTLAIGELPEFITGKMKIIGPASKEITELNLRFANKSLPDPRGPYDLLVFDVEVSTKQIPSDKAGEYLFQFCGKTFTTSNVLAIQIAHDEGQQTK